MYDQGRIITGIVIGLVILTFPFWFNLGQAPARAPEAKIAEAAKAAGECIAPKDEIKTSHMQVLDDWRNTVVRDADRFYTAENGKQYEMSLQNTCMKCHTSKVEFCDQCHNYAAVSPFCWDCHVAPKEKN